MKPTKPRKRPSERVSFPTSYGTVSFIPGSFKKQKERKVECSETCVCGLPKDSEAHNQIHVIGGNEPFTLEKFNEIIRTHHAYTPKGKESAHSIAMRGKHSRSQ